MSSYLRSWLYGATALTTAPDPQITLHVSPPPSVHDDSTGDDSDDDSPPTFPALSSAQRLPSPSPVSGKQPSSSALPSILSDAQLMPPPPLPSKALRVPGVPSLSTSLSVPRSSMLALPPTTTKAPVKPSKRREKVALAPGFGPLDWAALKSSGADLRGVETLHRITPSMLKEHNKRDDAWSAFNGKVYNITPYLPFHPGGEKELMRVAGRDGTKLFASTHAWVNVDFMLDACMVGFLVPESSS